MSEEHLDQVEEHGALEAEQAAIENEDDSDTQDGAVEPESFPKEYVEKLRAEAAENRVKAKRADEYAQRLHTALTAATGRLQDPSDLPFDQNHLDDPEALETAITELLDRKPHLATRKPAGNIGQGITGDTDSSVNLATILKGNL